MSSLEERIAREEAQAIEAVLRESPDLGIVSPWLLAQKVREMLRRGESDRKIAELLFKAHFCSHNNCLELARTVRESYEKLANSPSPKELKLPL